MRIPAPRVGRERLLPPVLGLVDGIMNALTLAAGAIVHEGSRIGIGLSLRIAAFSLVTAAFVLFVARYAELRTDLVRAARQLNLLERGHLATTRLGQAVFRDAVSDAAAASIASCLGALLPLLVAAAVPSRSWVAVVVAVGMLALLGAALARTLDSPPLRWSLALAAGGILLTAIGLELRIA